jgi:hypothetical protein
MHGYASERRRCPIHRFYVEKWGNWQNQFTEVILKKVIFLCPNYPLFNLNYIVLEAAIDLFRFM